MRKWMQFALPAALLLAGAGLVNAQDRPVGEQQARSAKSVMPITQAKSVAAAKDEQPVKLRGRIVKQERGDQYLFTDGTGNVLVEISDKLLKGNKLSNGTEVEIDGTVNTRILRDPQVEARAVTVLAKIDPAPLNREPGSAPEERG